MSKFDLVPAYYDGQDRNSPPVFLKSRSEIKQLRKTKALDGWYQQNGAVFVIYRAAKPIPDHEQLIAAGNMGDAWIPRQSGYAGPLVLQMA